MIGVLKTKNPNTDTEKRQMRMQGEGSICKSRRQISEEANSCHPGPRLSSSRSERTLISVVEVLSLLGFVMAG
jgi:hypothetical protein